MKHLLLSLMLLGGLNSYAWLENRLGYYTEGMELAAINELIDQKCFDCGPNESGAALHSSTLLSSKPGEACYFFEYEYTWDDDYGTVSEFGEEEICVETDKIKDPSKSLEYFDKRFE